MVRKLNPDYIIDGSYGELRDENGDFLSQVQEVSFSLRTERQEIMRSGTRQVGYKAMSTSGEGSIRGYKVTSRFLELVSRMFRADRQQIFVGQLMVKLDSPGALGAERVLLEGVKFWEIDGGWSVNTMVEETVAFTFEGFRFLDQIEGDPTVDLQRYENLVPRN